MSRYEKMELESRVRKILEKIGVSRGQIVLDFGCGSGTYTIPTAKIAGEPGKVYALDKDRQVLETLASGLHVVPIWKAQTTISSQVYYA